MEGLKSFVRLIAQRKAEFAKRRREDENIKDIRKAVIELGKHVPKENKKEDILHLKNCTKTGDKKTLQNRAKRKYLSTALSLGLVKYCDENPYEDELKKILSPENMINPHELT